MKLHFEDNYDEKPILAMVLSTEDIESDVKMKHRF
jgi:hypothetical protein